MNRYFITLLMLTIPVSTSAQSPSKPGKPIKVVTKAPRQTPKVIRVLFGTSPPGLKAEVYHGKKLFGVTPFTHQFKYDSSPVDIAFKLSGYLTVNTRVFTVKSTKLIVKMTHVSQANTVYGYREKIPPDAGVPPPTSMPASQPSAPTAPTSAPTAPTSAPTTPTP